MVMSIESQARTCVEVKSVKIETPVPDQGFTDPMVWIYTATETFTERLSEMMAWLRRRRTIRDFDRKNHKVNPGDGLGWRSTFDWIFSPECPIRDHEVISAWVDDQISRREKSKKSIEFLIFGDL